MASVFPIYKPRGMTPLECVNTFKERYPEHASSTISYAGRLDPMAEGLLILLLNEANKEREHYQHLPKTYDFTVLFGIGTDSYDLLGKITAITTDAKISKSLITEGFVSSFVTSFTQAYPPFSSKPVQGKPLFHWARENKLDSIKIPTKDVEIFSLVTTATSTITFNELITDLRVIIPKIKGDFRQEEILNEWERYYKKYSHAEFLTVSFSASCTSGTYIRSLAHRMGNLLGYDALALQIIKTNQGDFTINNSLPIFSEK